MEDSTDIDLLTDAVGDGDVARVSQLLDTGIDVNSTNELGETPFSFACAYNQLAVAKLLVERGANINSIDLGGGSPLDWAVCQASPEFRRWLKSIGGKRHDTTYDEWPWPPRTCAH